MRHIVILRRIPVARGEEAIVLSDDFGVEVCGELGVVFCEIRGRRT